MLEVQFLTFCEGVGGTQKVGNSDISHLPTFCRGEGEGYPEKSETQKFPTFCRGRGQLGKFKSQKFLTFLLFVWG